MTAAKVREYQIELPHIRLASIDYGCSDKPLLLALHGWLDNANSFAPLAAALNDYRILAIDWPGHGLSEHRPGGYPLHWIDYLYDLHSVLMFLAQRGERPLAVIGHSLGGIVASAYLASHPECCDALVLIEALGPLTERPGKAQSRMTKSFDDHWRWATSAEQAKRYSSLDAVVEARHRITGLDRNACRLLLERNFVNSAQGVVTRTDPRLKLDSPLRLTPAHGEAFIRGFSLPSLVLVGSSGYEQLKSAIGYAEGLYQRLEQQTLDGDHHLHMTNANECASAIRRFLDTHNKG